MEKLIDQIYSEFDASITISPAKGKSFSEKEINWAQLTSIKGIKLISKSSCFDFFLKFIFLKATLLKSQQFE